MGWYNSKKKMIKWVKRYIRDAECLIGTSDASMTMTHDVMNVINALNEQLKKVGLWRTVHVRAEIIEKRYLFDKPYIVRNYPFEEDT